MALLHKLLSTNTSSDYATASHNVYFYGVIYGLPDVNCCSLPLFSTFQWWIQGYGEREGEGREGGGGRGREGGGEREREEEGDVEQWWCTGT